MLAAGRPIIEVVDDPLAVRVPPLKLNEDTVAGRAVTTAGGVKLPPFRLTVPEVSASPSHYKDPVVGALLCDGTIGLLDLQGRSQRGRRPWMNDWCDPVF